MGNMYNMGNKNKNTTKQLANAENAVKLSNKAMEVENRPWFVDIVLINEPKLSKMAMEAQNNDKDIQSPKNTFPPISNNLCCLETPSCLLDGESMVEHHVFIQFWVNFH